MQYRTLTNTSLTVSSIGFGGWGIGGEVPGIYSYGPKDVNASQLALRKAFACGVTFFDTSNSYGFGRSERLIGETLQEVRRHIIIATKGGYLDYFPPDGQGQRFDAEYIERSLRNSLIRLRTDYVDIFQIHSPPREAIQNNDELFSLLERVRKDGRVRYVGVAARNPEEAYYALMLKDFHFDILQFNLNLCDMRAIDFGLIQRASERGVAMMCRSPLLRGFLTGKLTKERVYHRSDNRGRFTQETRERWLAALDVYAPLLDSNYTPSQNALRFCLSFPNISTVITGMNTCEQVDENTKASDLPPFSNEQLQQALDIYHNNFQKYPPMMENSKKTEHYSPEELTV